MLFLSQMNRAKFHIKIGMEISDRQGNTSKNMNLNIYKQIRRLLVFLIGISITLLGLIAFFTPVPAIIIIPFGLAILATEFIWLKDCLRVLKKKTEELSETAKGVFKKKNS